MGFTFYLLCPILYLMSSSCSVPTSCGRCEVMEAINQISQMSLTCGKTNHKTASSAFVSYSWIVRRRVDTRVQLNSESRVTCESVHALQHLPHTNSLVSGGCFMLAAGSINRVPLPVFPCALFLTHSCLNNSLCVINNCSSTGTREMIVSLPFLMTQI